MADEPHDAPTATEAQVGICARDCGARCCRYVTVAVPTPRAHPDWDELRWWLAHPGLMVTKDEDGWMLHIESRCRHLLPDNRCGIYEARMTACESYDPAACEFTDDVDYEVRLRTEADLADYLERKRLKRGAAVAEGIRRASSSNARPALVPLHPLAEAR